MIFFQKTVTRISNLPTLVNSYWYGNYGIPKRGCGADCSSSLDGQYYLWNNVIEQWTGELIPKPVANVQAVDYEQFQSFKPKIE